MLFNFQDQYHYNLTGIRVIGYCVGPTESDSLSHNRHNSNTPNHERARKIDMHGITYQKYGYEEERTLNAIEISCGIYFIVE